MKQKWEKPFLIKKIALNQSLQLSSIRTIQVCIGGGSDPASLYLPVIEMSLATYLCFILDFLRQMGDCIKRALEFENNSKIVALSRHKRKLPTLPLWDWLGLVGKSIQSKIYFVSTKPMEICTTTTAVSSLWRKTVKEGRNLLCSWPNSQNFIDSQNYLIFSSYEDIWGDKGLQASR